MFGRIFGISEASYQILLAITTLLATSRRKEHPLNGPIHVKKLSTTSKGTYRILQYRSTCTRQTFLTLHCDARVFTWSTMWPGNYEGREKATALEDQDVTTFCTPRGIFCYRVTPLGLKNAGATYQRAMYLWKHAAENDKALHRWSDG